MYCVLRTMIFFRVSLAGIVLAAAATAACAASAPAGCAGVSPSVQVEGLISLQSPKTDSSGICDAISDFTRRVWARKEKALAPAMVRNPFLPAQSIPYARPTQPAPGR
jgi:hypothetical protein